MFAGTVVVPDVADKDLFLRSSKVVLNGGIHVVCASGAPTAIDARAAQAHLRKDGRFVLLDLPAASCTLEVGRDVRIVENGR